MTAPGGIVEVLKALLLNVVDNPVKAIYNANYIGILAWAILLGLALRNAADTTKTMISNFSDAVIQNGYMGYKVCAIRNHGSSN